MKIIETCNDCRYLRIDSYGVYYCADSTEYKHIADYHSEIKGIHKDCTRFKDKICTWKLLGEPFVDNYYKTSCDNDFDYFVNDILSNNFKFCPYCGGKIEVKEELKNENNKIG